VVGLKKIALISTSYSHLIFWIKHKTNKATHQGAVSNILWIRKIKGNFTPLKYVITFTLKVFYWES